MGRRVLNARVAQDLDPELLDFINVYVDSFVKWELLRFFYANPNTIDTAVSIARYIGRSAQDIQDDLFQLKEHGLLKESAVGHMFVYTLNPAPELWTQLEKFIQATQDPEFRRKAIYHLVR